MKYVLSATIKLVIYGIVFFVPQLRESVTPQFGFIKIEARDCSRFLKRSSEEWSLILRLDLLLGCKFEVDHDVKTAV